MPESPFLSFFDEIENTIPRKFETPTGTTIDLFNAYMCRAPMIKIPAGGTRIPRFEPAKGEFGVKFSPFPKFRVLRKRQRGIEISKIFNGEKWICSKSFIIYSSYLRPSSFGL